MAKDKFDLLKKGKTQDVVKEAALKENKSKKDISKTEQVNVSAFRTDVKDAILNNKEMTGISLNAYIKAAVYAKAKADGLIEE